MAKKIILSLLTVSLIVLACFHNAVYVNTEQFQIREEKLVSEKIPNDCDGLLIAYFSDICLNDFLDAAYIDKVTDTINSFDPDVILFGGDLFDSDQMPDQASIDHLKKALSDLNAPYGKYAVSGDEDHESYDRVNTLLEEAGFTLINNRTVLISVNSSSYFNIIGIDSLVNGSPDLNTAFATTNSSYYSLLVSHCPDIADSLSAFGGDYLLSGHSRGGQVWFPIIRMFNRPYGARSYYRGKSSKNGLTVDITNGLGRKDVDARFQADAEIVLYTLKSTAE